MRTAIVVGFAVALAFVGCDTQRRPSYDDLKAENEQLQAQLEETHDKIQQAKSDLDDLKTEIQNVEAEPCYEDSASDLSVKADEVESTLDEADDDSN